MIQDYKGPDLTNAQVLYELEKVQELGWEVRKLREWGENQYLIQFDNNKHIHIALSGIYWCIMGDNNSINIPSKYVSTINDFIESLQKISNDLGYDIKHCFVVFKFCAFTTSFNP